MEFNSGFKGLNGNECNIHNQCVTKYKYFAVTPTASANWTLHSWRPRHYEAKMSSALRRVDQRHKFFAITNILIITPFPLQSFARPPYVRYWLHDVNTYTKWSTSTITLKPRRIKNPWSWFEHQKQATMTQLLREFPQSLQEKA